MRQANLYNILSKVTTAEPKQTMLVSLLKLYVWDKGGDEDGI